MSLSSELISQFAKITNDEKPKKSEEVTLYGEVVELEEMICVRFDGAEELTPVTTIVEKDDTGEIVNYKYGAASVKSGDRVSVSLKNHSATITGNLSDPPAGRAEFIVGLDTIVAKIGEDVQLKLDGVEKSITAQVENTNVRIDNMGVTISNNYTELSNAISSGDSELSEAINALNSSLSQDISDAVTTINGKIDVNTNDISTVVNNLTALKEGFKDGTTVISGGCITTGMIDAKYLNLTGAITFVDLNAETQSKITDAESTANSALSTANGAASTANSALSAANSAASDASGAYDAASSAQSVAKSIANGSYLKGTFINGKKISSPEIEGNNIKVYGTFQTIGNDDVGQMVTGYMGAAQGLDESGNVTYGVAIARSWDSLDYNVSNSYVIVTNAGVRLQFADNSLVVTRTGIWLDTSGTAKAYYNNVEIGSGSGGTATFG